MQTIFPLLEDFMRKKAVAFVVFCWLNFVLLVGFGLICTFVGSKFFCRKNWNCLDSLIYYTADVYPPQPVFQKFICTHLFLLVIICKILFFYENLFKSFLFVKIFLILFFLWSSVRISFCNSLVN